jgi:hypothetical protein
MKTEKQKYALFPNRLFVGEVIEDEQHRQFVIDSIELLYNPKQKIRKTKLLYSFPMMKVQNPHKHIDNIQNYVIIIELEKHNDKGNPYVLAMHSERPLN